MNHWYVDVERLESSCVEVASTSVGELVDAFESTSLLVSFVGAAVGESVGDFECVSPVSAPVGAPVGAAVSTCTLSTERTLISPIVSFTCRVVSVLPRRRFWSKIEYFHTNERFLRYASEQNYRFWTSGFSDVVVCVDDADDFDLISTGEVLHSDSIGSGAIVAGFDSMHCS